MPLIIIILLIIVVTKSKNSFDFFIRETYLKLNVKRLCVCFFFFFAYYVAY